MIALKLKCDEGERMKKRKIDFFSFFSKTNEERVKIWWEVNTGEDTIESVYFCNGKCFIIATPKSKTKERKKERKSYTNKWECQDYFPFGEKTKSDF